MKNIINDKYNNDENNSNHAKRKIVMIVLKNIQLNSTTVHQLQIFFMIIMVNEFNETQSKIQQNQESVLQRRKALGKIGLA